MTADREGGATMSADELFAAIDAGDSGAVERLIRRDRGLASARDGDGVSATMHALYHGRAEIARTVAAALPSLDIFEAAALGDADAVGQLLAGDAGLASALSPDGFTALHYPAFFGEGRAADVARLLLAAGADVDARSTNDFSVLPLHSAVAGNHEDVVTVLLEAGADVNARQRHGYTPLHGAAQNGSVSIVEELLAAGADRTATTDDGRTPADLARAAGHADLAAPLG